MLQKQMKYKELREEIRKRDYKNIVGLKASLTEKEYWYFLEVLPPIYTKQGFMMLEALTHDPEGNAIRYHITGKKGGYMIEVVNEADYVKRSDLIKAGLI